MVIKRKRSVEARRRLREKYKIHFQGPQPPKKWPEKQKHLFSVIRNIWNIRYDDYEQDDRVHERTRRLNLDRANRLRRAAYNMRKDLKTTEGSWRMHVEPIVKEIFSRTAKWSVSASNWLSCIDKSQVVVVIRKIGQLNIKPSLLEKKIRRDSEKKGHSVSCACALSTSIGEV